MFHKINNNTLIIEPIKKINGIVKVPGSKSIAIRALFASILSSGYTKLINLPINDDIKHTLNIMSTIGIKYEFSPKKNECIIKGNPNLFKNKFNFKLYTGSSGLLTRILISMFCISKHNNIILDGSNQIKKRPIYDLVNALLKCGADIRYINEEGYLPICLKHGITKSDIQLNANLSSQFLTSMLIAFPLRDKDSQITIKQKLTSEPYIKLTIEILKKFNIEIINKRYKKYIIHGNQTYKTPKKLFIEGDISSASYFLAAAAIKGGKVKINGINSYSIQPDIMFINLLKKMGAKIKFTNTSITCTKYKILKSINIDANSFPDAAMTAAIVALFSNKKSKIYNIYNWRIKESNRLSAIFKALTSIGANIKIGYDYILINPPHKFKSSSINTYNDHRVAMCCALLALAEIQIKIINYKCVKKTFPNYFRYLRKISLHSL